MNSADHISRRFCLAFLLVLLVTPSGMSQHFWEQAQGPYGGSVYALAISPSGTLFAGSAGAGVFRSTDRGATWIQSNDRLDGYAVMGLAVTKAGHILAATWEGGVFRSTNDGANWSQANVGLYGSQQYRLYGIVVGSNGDLFVGTNGAGVFRSIDNGEFWFPTGELVGAINGLAVARDGALFAATSTGIYRSGNNGQSWLQVSNTYASIVAVAANGHIFVGTHGSGVGLSMNNGQSWTFSTAGIPSGWVLAIGFDSTGRVYAATDRNVCQLSDNGHLWVPISTDFSYTMGLSFVTHPQGQIFAGTDGSGIMTSTDNGRTWRMTNQGLRNASISSLVSVTRDVAFATGPGLGLVRSTDGGVHWDPVSAPATLQSPLLGIDHRGRLMASSRQDGILRSSDHGLSWSLSGPANATVLSTVVNRRGHLLAGTSYEATGGTIFRSTDDGRTWANLNIGQAFYVWSMAMDSSGNLYAGTNGLGLLRSTDDGLTWFPTTLLYADVNALLCTSVGNLFAGTEQSGIYRSTDRGVTWKAINGYFSFSDKSFRSLAANTSGQVFAAAPGGRVYLSMDEGESWVIANDGLPVFPTSSVQAFTVTPDGYLLAGTYNQGVYRSTFSNSCQVVLNSGFESGMFPWSFHTDGKAATDADAQGVSSPHAYHITILEKGNNTQLFQSETLLEPDTRYRLRFSAYSSTGRDFSVSVLQHGAPYTSYGLRDREIDLSTSWNTYVCEFRTPAVGRRITDGRVMFWFASFAENGDEYFIDDVVLEVADSVQTPLIVSHPVHQTVTMGRPAHFVVRAVGAMPLLYQWQRNDVDIAGATDSVYRIGVTRMVDSGLTYRCMVSNGFGRVASARALLSVTRVPNSLVQNSGFESGTTPWVFHTNASGRFTADAAGPASPHAGHVALASAGSNVQLHQTGFPLEGNKRYRLAFSARSNSGHDCEIAIFKNTQPYTSYGLVGVVCDVDSLWKPFAYEFMTPVSLGMTADTRLMFWFTSYGVAGDEYWLDDVSLEPVDVGPIGLTAVNSDDTQSVPREFSLGQNYPNPFNGATILSYSVRGTGGQGLGASDVRLVVYDILGREVAVLVDRRKEPGEYSATFDAAHLPSGVYLVRLEAGEFVATRRMLLIR